MKRKTLTQKNYYQVSAWMVLNYNLKGNELICYSIIYGFSQDGITRFNGSLSYLSEFMNCSLTTTKNTLKLLVKKGLLSKFDKEYKKYKLCEYIALTPSELCNITPKAEIALPPKAEIALPPKAEIALPPKAEIAPNNEDYNKKNKLTKEIEGVLLEFEYLYKKKFNSVFSYAGKYNKTYQLQAIELLLEEKKDVARKFLQNCFTIEDSYLEKRLSPSQIMQNINSFTMAIANPTKKDFVYFTYEQILSTSDRINKPFDKYCRVKVSGSVVYVEKGVAEKYKLEEVMPGKS